MIRQRPAMQNHFSARSVEREWVSAIDYGHSLRETAEEKARRVGTRSSKNLRAAQRDLEERKLREGLKKRASQPSAKSKSVIQVTTTSMEEIEKLLIESDRVLAEARTLLAQHYQSAIPAR
ncbi:hypothetical protein RvY_16000 [Ramazzottius varieornatus]|uniref:Uncharacterized protein n=1 Tax=Ramazzottius varieornatus TaxID=947166 RepID=A0A1D1VWX2_RAMVA|nr:hypothetical protein RvY_16000 [Ramazzottius varieornatus]